MAAAMRGATIGRAPTILQDHSFYTRISNFVQSPILSAARIRIIFFTPFFLFAILMSLMVRSLNKKHSLHISWLVMILIFDKLSLSPFFD